MPNADSAIAGTSGMLVEVSVSTAGAVAINAPANPAFVADRPMRSASDTVASTATAHHAHQVRCATHSAPPASKHGTSRYPPSGPFASSALMRSGLSVHV